MDLLFEGGSVVTMNAERRVHARADVLVRDGRIAAIGRVRPDRPTRVLSAAGCAVMPGLVQAHVHLCQALFRGAADDLPLLEWLRTRIWPLEAAHTERSLRASADLGLAELLLGGTTTILDMGTVRHGDVVFEAMRDAGIRGASGKAMMDMGDGVPKRLRETTRASLAESTRLCERWHGAAGGRLMYAFAPRFVLSCSERLLRETAERAAAHEAIVHTHAAEHASERDAVRRLFGRDDVAVLRALGIGGPRAVLAHGVQLRDDEMEMLARDGTRIVHCPSANLKLGSGIARVAALRARGVVVGLGADGAPCNNRMDAWTELRTASLLGKVAAGAAEALPAEEALALATIEGARVLGLEREIGSVEVGKRADLIAVRIDGVHQEPGGTAPSRLAYAANASDVRHVVIDGRIIVQDRELLTLDAPRVRATARGLAMAM